MSIWREQCCRNGMSMDSHIQYISNELESKWNFVTLPTQTNDIWVYEMQIECCQSKSDAVVNRRTVSVRAIFSAQFQFNGWLQYDCTTWALHKNYSKLVNLYAIRRQHFCFPFVDCNFPSVRFHRVHKTSIEFWIPRNMTNNAILRVLVSDLIGWTSKNDLKWHGYRNFDCACTLFRLLTCALPAIYSTFIAYRQKRNIVQINGSS